MTLNKKVLSVLIAKISQMSADLSDICNKEMKTMFYALKGKLACFLINYLIFMFLDFESVRKTKKVMHSFLFHIFVHYFNSST